MTTTRSVSDEIVAEVTSWPGVHAAPGDLGELGFKLGRREIGHLHGDRAAHFSFPKKLWAELREQGRIVPHPVSRFAGAGRPLHPERVRCSRSDRPLQAQLRARGGPKRSPGRGMKTNVSPMRHSPTMDRRMRLAVFAATGGQGRPGL